MIAMSESSHSLEELLQSMPKDIVRIKGGFSYLRSRGLIVIDPAEKKIVRKHIARQRKRRQFERRQQVEPVLMCWERTCFDEYGHLGEICDALLLAIYSSQNAKADTGRGAQEYYLIKDDALARLCELLVKDSCGITWGWCPMETNASSIKWALHIDLPQGQASFHCPERFDGPAYEGRWDGRHENMARAIDFCAVVMGSNPLGNEESF